MLSLIIALCCLASDSMLKAQTTNFHNAPAPPPKPPFTDYRLEKPGQIHKITLKDLPAPFDTPSASNGPAIVPRPQNAWPKAPAGFEVTLYTTGLDNPRRIRRAPNGDLFVAEVSTGKVEIFRGIDSAGHPQRTAVFASLDRPFGMNFYPPGPDPHWVYVATKQQSFASLIATGICRHAGRPNTSWTSRTTVTIIETFYLNLAVKKCWSLCLRSRTRMMRMARWKRTAQRYSNVILMVQM